jgi:hypothetical protein
MRELVVNRLQAANVGMRALRSLLLVAAAFTHAQLATAHHSYAMFDTSQQGRLSGTVKAFEWTAPHVWVWVVADDGNGGVRTYGFECVDPHALSRWSGWSMHSLNVGDKVTVVWHPLKNGKDGGSLVSITLADGRVLTNVGPQPKPLVN